MLRAMVGDTSVPVYGAPDDKEYAQSDYAKVDDAYTGYTEVYPKYVPKPRKLFEKSSTIDVYNTYDKYVSPKIWIKPANSWSWIDASKNRGKIKAAIAVIFGLILFVAGAMVLDMYLKKNLPSN